VSGRTVTLCSRARQADDHPLDEIYRETPPNIQTTFVTFQTLMCGLTTKNAIMSVKEGVTYFKAPFFPTYTLRLDAQGMDLKNISIVKNGKMFH